MSDKYGNTELEQAEFSEDMQRLVVQMQDLVKNLGTIEGGTPVGFSFTLLTQDDETHDTTALAHAWFGGFINPEENSKSDLLADAFAVSCAHTRAVDRAVHEAIDEIDGDSSPLLLTQ